MCSAPHITAPAARMRRTRKASRLAGGLSRSIFEPASVVTPSKSNRFFTATGTPASGPGSRPAATASSTASASARARAAVISVKAL